MTSSDESWLMMPHTRTLHLLIRLSLIPRWIDPTIFPSKMCNIGPFQSTDRQTILLHPSFLRADSHQYCFKPIYQVPNYYHHFYCAVNAIWPHFEIYARLASLQILHSPIPSNSQMSKPALPYSLYGFARARVALFCCKFSSRFECLLKIWSTSCLVLPCLNQLVR